MITEDFYTGEPVDTGSPNLFDNKKDEMEAANMASFAKYDYDPGMRANNFVSPGGYGYMPQYGIGAMPNPMFTNQPNPALAPGGPFGFSNQFGWGNMPGWGMQPMYTPPVYQPQQELPETIHIPGINLSGEYLMDKDIDDRIEKLKAEYIMKKEEIDAKKHVDSSNNGSNSVYGYGNMWGLNYYGASYYNPYQYNSLNQYISKELDSIKDEARENRMAFQLQLSRLAHNVAKDGVTDEEIKERYCGRTITTPKSIVQTPQEYYLAARLNSMVPFDNSQNYRNYELSVQKEYNEYIPKDADMQTAFSNMALLWAKWEMEDEMHRRRDGSQLYNSDNNAYKYYIRKKAEERYRQEKGIANIERSMSNMNPNQIGRDFIAGSPLSQVATLADDGELKINLTLPYNVGSKMGQVYSVNQNEKEYEERRQRFGQFINSIDTSDKNELNILKQKKFEEFSG